MIEAGIVVAVAAAIFAGGFALAYWGLSGQLELAANTISELRADLLAERLERKKARHLADTQFQKALARAAVASGAADDPASAWGVLFGTNPPDFTTGETAGAPSGVDGAPDPVES